MEPVSLSLAETGKALGGLSRTTIWRLVRDGELQKIRVGARTLVSVESIKEFAARQARAA